MWASPIARFVGCRPAQASVVLRKPVEIIVMSVMSGDFPDTYRVFYMTLDC
jgi:hypothetical protein